MSLVSICERVNKVFYFSEVRALLSSLNGEKENVEESLNEPEDSSLYVDWEEEDVSKRYYILCCHNSEQILTFAPSDIADISFTRKNLLNINIVIKIF